MRTLIAIIVGVGVLGYGAFYYMQHVAAEPPSNFRTAPVARGDMLPTISATGTAEPEEVVDVGAQVAGLIYRLGSDPHSPGKVIDYCSNVEVDTVLAYIDDSLYRAQVAQDKAALQHSMADLGQMQAKLLQCKNDWKRAEDLKTNHPDAIAATDYDAAVANYKVAEANVHVGEAAIEQDKATLHKDEINLGYTVIKSPVKGTVVTRRVNVGQTVVSSLNAPSLFLIAKDLSRLQIWASVNEADIGRIRPGMPVHFTVDAYPNETFLGKVLQIRLNATMTQNVVTYTVVVETDNSDMKLKPYMTANLQFETDHHKDVLMVPNAALRWKPRSSQVVPALRASLRSAGNEEFGKEGRESRGEEAPARPAEGSKSADAKPAGPKAGGPKATESNAGGAKPDAAQAGQARPAKEHVERGRIWIKDGDYVRPVNVRIIATDGTNTEVTGRDLQDGLEVVVGENVAADESGDTTNPFAPKIFKGKK